MGRIYLLPLAAGLAAALPLTAEDWRPGTYMSEAMQKIIAMGSTLEAKSQFGWDPDLCLMAAFLRPRGTVEFNIRLEAGASYAFIGGGDNSVEDLDLEVLRNGQPVKRDTETDATPVVLLNPSTTGTYVLRLRLYKASVGSFAGVAILKRGGFAVPIKNLARAFDRNLSLARRVDELRGGARYHDHNNQWAIYGWVIREGEDRGISRMTFSGGHYFVLVAGDANARDLDLVVKRGDTPIASDSEDDPNPVAGFNASGPDYSFTVSNRASNGATLVLASVIESEANR